MLVLRYHQPSALLSDIVFSLLPLVNLPRVDGTRIRDSVLCIYSFWLCDWRRDPIDSRWDYLVSTCKDTFDKRNADEGKEDPLSTRLHTLGATEEERASSCWPLLTIPAERSSGVFILFNTTFQVKQAFYENFRRLSSGSSWHGVKGLYNLPKCWSRWGIFVHTWLNQGSQAVGTPGFTK